MTQNGDHSPSSDKPSKRRTSPAKSKEFSRLPDRHAKDKRDTHRRTRSGSPRPRRRSRDRQDRHARSPSRDRSSRRHRSVSRSRSRSRSRRDRSPRRTRSRSLSRHRRSSKENSRECSTRSYGDRDRRREHAGSRGAQDHKHNDQHSQDGLISISTKDFKTASGDGVAIEMQAAENLPSHKDDQPMPDATVPGAATSPAKRQALSVANGADGGQAPGQANGHANGSKQIARLSFEDELEDGVDQTESRPSLRQLTESRMEYEHKLSRNAAPVQLVDNPTSYASALTGTTIREDDGQLLASTSAASPSSSLATQRVLGRIHVGVAQARGLRQYMEDRHTIVADLVPRATLADGAPRSLYAVYDGHNGVRAADTAAARMHQLLASDPSLRAYTGASTPASVAKAEEVALRAALQRAFREVDDEVLAGSRMEGGRDGATALVLLRLGQALYAAHAGDSRAVLCRGGAATRLTEDHKPNLPAERARVEAVGGRVEFQRCWRVIVQPRPGRPGSGLAVSRALGDLDFKEPSRFVECEPDVQRMQLQPDDRFVILGSDGLWDVISDSDAVATAQVALEAAAAKTQRTVSDEAATAAAEALLAEAVARGTADNVTVLLLLMQWD